MNALDYSPFINQQQFQEKELKRILEYVNSNSPFYKNHFSKNGVVISQIKSLSDLAAIPFTNKQDLQDHNWDFLCVERSELIEYCTTSGTLGLPVTIGLTENDLKRLAINEYQSFQCAGITKDDVILLMLSLDRQFMAGMAYYHGAREMGAGIIRGGPGNFTMQLETIVRLMPTILIAVPSFIVGLVDYANEKQFDLNTTSVSKIICIGENIRNEDLSQNALANRIKQNWEVELISTYASTEQQTAFTECSHGMGGHHHPELMIFEIVDDNGKLLSPGDYGELVITTLGVEGMPLIRYQTGDICTYFESQCKCGRFSSRLSPIMGRKQQLIKYKGTTLYPQMIFNLLNSLESIQDYVVSLHRNELGTDELHINIALNPSAIDPEKSIKQSLQSTLRVVPAIKYISLAEVQNMQVIEGKRKINKLLDNRF